MPRADENIIYYTGIIKDMIEATAKEVASQRKDGMIPEDARLSVVIDPEKFELPEAPDGSINRRQITTEVSKPKIKSNPFI